RMREAVEESRGAPGPRWTEFEARLHYIATPFEDPAGFSVLSERLRALDREHGTSGNRLFYLAVPPGVVCPVAGQLHRAHLVHDPDGERWSRVIVEKPFGHDLESARALNAELTSIF